MLHYHRNGIRACQFHIYSLGVSLGTVKHNYELSPGTRIAARTN